MKGARKHHFIPQFYLANFTKKGSRKSRLWVHDLKKKERRSSKVQNIGHHRDFYRIEAEDFDPNHVENEFSKIETWASNLIRGIIIQKELPKEEELVNLLTFVSMMYVRVPKWRRFSEKANLRMSDLLAEMSLSSREKWESQVEEMRHLGLEVPDDCDYDEVKADWDSGRIVSVPCQNLEIQLMTSLILRSTEILCERYWNLFIAPNSEGEFITCDCPVIPVRTRKTDPLGPVGLAMRDVDIQFALSPNVLLIGTYERIPNPLVARLDHIALANTNAVGWADRNLYSRAENPICLLPNEEFGTVERGIREIRKTKNDAQVH